MSRYLSKKYADLVPYVPGEQPRDRAYIKLNTNESPFPPSRRAQKAAKAAAKRLALYPDPTMKALREAFAEAVGVTADCCLAVNGSDEILNFAFAAFCDEDTPAVYADITYGFYGVFADLYRLPRRVIPLTEDLTIDPTAYYNAGGTVFIANPNAPTGIALSLDEIEGIVKNNPDNIVVVDEAYVDFGAKSAVTLTKKYDNLLVTQTFSKSRSMAGARLGFGIACPALIRDLDAIKYSTNPYNVNAMTAAVGIGTLADPDYTKKNCKAIMETREYVLGELRAMGFSATASVTNFVFATHPRLSGEAYYTALRERGILVRHFTGERIAEYNRITIGSRAEMNKLLLATKAILEEKQ